MRAWIHRQWDRLQEGKRRAIEERLDELKVRYQIFRGLQETNNRAVDLITDLDTKFRASPEAVGALRTQLSDLIDATVELVDQLNRLEGEGYRPLYGVLERIRRQILQGVEALPEPAKVPPCLPLDRAAEFGREVVGGKAFALAKLRAAGGFGVPAGFVVPVQACRQFLEANQLVFAVRRRLQRYLHGPSADIPAEVLEAVRQEILSAPLPRPLETALEEAAGPFFAGSLGLAVRSSAISEDGDQHSFAGQFRTVLNVRSLPGLFEAVKEVVASSFSGRSLVYRASSGLDPLDFNMAVVAVEMIPARSAGVLFTVDPTAPEAGRMVVSAVLGLGELVVGGEAETDVYHPARSGEPGKGLPASIPRKRRRLVCRPEGGVAEETVPEDEGLAPVLSERQLQALVDVGLRIEAGPGGALDVEWAFDEGGALWILQARPLRVAGQAGARAVADGRQPILAGGTMVSAGRGTGQVAIVRKREDLETLPDTALILAMPHSLVDAAQILPKVQGILVEFGNPTDHLSCVAREYGLPMLTGLSGATDRLSPGTWITLDPEAGRVFEAQEAEKEEALARRAALAQAAPQPSHPVPEALRPLWTRAVKLNLTDAYGPTFSMQECQSLHDIVRFIHEKAVLGMFELNDEVLERASGAVFRLEYDGPFFFYIIDLGGGLLPGRPARGSVIRPGDVYSVPFKALWRGLSTPGLRGTSPAGQGSMAPVVSRWMVDQRSGRPLGLPNYIILTRDYMNLNARLDFHFTMIDALCGLEARSNYIKFRFKGGGTSPAKRNRRARFLAEVLEADGFYTDLQNDLVNATFMGAPGPVIEEKLVNLGRLMDFSRLLDMVMTDDEAPRRLAEAFWAGNYRLEGLMAPTAPPGDQA